MPESPSGDGAPEPSGGSVFSIVGIGASAGGLEAFSQLLKALPADTGMAFVLLQHLDPLHESQLSEILSRTTAMPVTTVTDRLRAEPDHVYVIPANADMTITGGAFVLSRRNTIDRHTPVDHFFRSLAQEQAERAIGAVLSGTGSDGTLGLQAIKAAGGITLVQDEKSAKHPGMPQSAASVADFVLAPAEIAAELARIGRHPYVMRASPSDAEPDPAEDTADVSAVLRVLRAVTGVDFAQYKPATVRRRIARRMLLHRTADLEAYVRRLRQAPDEAQALHDDLLIQVTGFFRDPEGFEALRRTVFPSLVKERASDQPIRMWVAGCATGEEAYSLVICLREFLEEMDHSFPIQMFATDLSASAVTRARAGMFPLTIEHEISADRLRRFFVTVDGRYQISKAVRDQCVFASHDLTRDPPFSRLDLISCCNVLIYLSPAVQERIIPILHYALKPTGFLKLGPSESVGRSTQLFSAVDKTHRIYGRKPGRSAHLGFGLTAGDRAPAPVGTQLPAAGVSAAALEKEADRLILGRYAPAGVVVNADMQIMQFRGKTGPYLEGAPGAASLDLFKMVREGLASALRRAVQQATQRQIPVKAEGLRIKANGGILYVGLEVVPIGPADGMKHEHYLILFSEERAPGAPPAPARPAPRPKTVGERRVAQLAQELADARSQLQASNEAHEAAVEELRAATEEAQSSNEELQSTNEELETSKEELQATNEELTTVNDELNSRNIELNQVSNDLGNLLTSSHVPILLVGLDLRVRRMTPVAERVLNLAAGDIGRPLGDLRLSVDVPHLEALLRDVIETLSPQERELEARDGRWYSVRVRPYRTADNKIDGAIVSFVDIDTVKRAFEQAKAARDQAEAIIATVREPLVVLDADLRVVTASRSFCETFRVASADVEGRSLFEIENRRWNIPALRTLLEEVLPRDRVVNDFEVEHDFQSSGRRIMLLNARRLLSGPAQPGSILLAMEDVTERRSAEDAIRRVAALVEGTEDAVVGKTLDGIITSWNRGAEQMFGYAADEVVGRSITVIIPPERRDEEVDILSRLRRGEGTQYETVRVRKDGIRRDVALTVSPVRDGAGRVIGASKIARDITDRKHLEGERAELLTREQAVRAEAEGATLAKDKFVAVLSHELRTPLNAMLGWARMLRTQKLDEATVSHALEVIERNTLLQARLIEDLLDASRIVTGTLSLEMRPVVISSTVEAAINAVRSSAEARGVRLDSQLDVSVGPVRGDPTRLQQIVWNLVSNAIKFTPRGGRVEIRLVRRDSAVEVSVRDTGKGISAEELPDIFDRFGVGHGRTQSHGGLGLGLSIVRHLVQLHGGTVHADSAGLGQGATFTVTLPVTAEGAGDGKGTEAEGTTSRDLADARLPALNGVRVLVVDDEADARELMRAVFVKCGAQVTVAATAQAALEAIGQTPFDVLVSDIGMPEYNGYDLIRDVRALGVGRGGQIPALALTAYARIEDRAEAIAAGYQQHAAKPIDPAELAAAVATLTGRAGAVGNVEGPRSP